jgi:hypothetical protein
MPGTEVAERFSRKRLILACRDEQHLESAGLPELRRIQNGIRERRAPARPPSLAYIAAVLREAGTRVDYEDRFADPVIPERYRSRLEGVLRFHDLAAAESALGALDAAWRAYRSAADREGAALVRKLALRGRQRAESLAANPRVDPAKRRQKREIANWFRVWLENPGLFFDWLDLRKRADDFRELFPEHDRVPPESGSSGGKDAKS